MKDKSQFVDKKDKDLLEYIGTRWVSPTPGVHVQVRRFKIKGDCGPRAGIKGSPYCMEYPRWYGASAGPRLKDVD